MVEPKIIVKVRKPTEEFDETDSDFEVLSDSGNDDNVINGGYQRLQDETIGVVMVHEPPMKENNEIVVENSEFNENESKEKENKTKPGKLVISLSQQQISSNKMQIFNGFSPTEHELKPHRSSSALLSIDPHKNNVNGTSNKLKEVSFGPLSPSSNFAERLSIALKRRNSLIPEESGRKISVSAEQLHTEKLQQLNRKLSDTVVTQSNKLLPVEEITRKASMPSVLPSSDLMPHNNNTSGSSGSGSKVHTNDHETVPETQATPKLFLYRTFNNLNSIDSIRNEPVPSTSKVYVTQQSTDLIDYIPNKLKCPICKCIFKDPRVLSCLHSFCLECLMEIDLNRNASSSRFWRKYSGNNSEFDWDFPDKKCSSITGSILSGDDTSSVTKSPPIVGIKDRRHSKARPKSVSSDRHASTVSFNEKLKSIVCPTCGTATEIPIGGLNRLPHNFILMRQIEEAVVKTGIQQVAKVWCSLCSNEVIATAYCISCGYNLCNFCKDAHKRQRTTAMHEVKVFVEAKKLTKRQSDKQIKRSVRCPMHPNNELKIFCTTCHQVVCNDCTILLHRGHKCISIIKASKVYMRLLSDNLERTRPLTDYSLHSKLKMTETSKKINQRCEQVQKEVEQFLNEYFEALEVHKKTLLNQISRARENKMEVVLARQADLDRRCDEAKTAITFAEELIQEGSDVEKLSFVGILLKRLDHCQKSQSSVDMKVSDSLQFLPEVKAPSNKAQNNIPLYGIITTQTAASKFCCLEKTEDLLNLRVHKKAELILISKDNDDRQMCHGGLTINAELKYKDSSCRPIPVQLSDKRDGTYTISFVPDSAGIMVLSISVNSKPIKDSPFTLRARTLKPHSGIYHCCAFCSSSGSKLATCACGSQMPGGYAGCGHGHPGHPGRRHWSCCSSVLENSECTVANAVVHQSTETLDQ